MPVNALQLLVVLPATPPRTVTLGSAPVVIGRRDADLVIPDDAYLSSRHFKLQSMPGGTGVVMEDLGSTNGVFIRIRDQIELRPGDEVVIGGQVFRFMV